MKRLFVRGAVLVGVALLLGCGSVAPSAQLPAVTARGDTLRAGWGRFTVRGVNYIAPGSADRNRCADLHFDADPNCPWDMEPILADFDQLQARGVNTLRIFLNYYVFGGAQAADPNYRMDTALAHLDTLIAEANRRGMYVIPVLMAKYPQDRFGPDAYETTLSLHVRPVVQHLANRPGILMWDLFNEIDIGSPVDQRCWDWDNADFPLCYQLAEERLRFVQVIHDEVRRIDPQRLTTVSLAFAKNHAEPAEADTRIADIVDVFTFHYYDNDPYDSGRYAAHWYYGQGFPADLERSVAELQALGRNKPIVVTELGFPTGTGAQRDDAALRRDLARSAQVLDDMRTSGVVLWPFQPTPEALVGDLFTR